MNVFADLIEELKEENLLEDTVICVAPESAHQTQDSESDHEADITELSDPVDSSQTAVDSNDLDFGLSMSGAPEPSVDKRDFYRKRAMEEVSSLQMVEHVLSGIEREHMKMTPATYDDLEVKKALHRFLQIVSDENSEDHSTAEFDFMKETEKWHSALAKRDSNISVANIRRFCENSRPVLSSQALVALARFYRNAPFTEPVRGKFDFVMTRLFSREIEDDHRKLLFDFDEMVGHIKRLYCEWSSLNLFDEPEEGIEETGARFAAFTDESEQAVDFDSLVKSEFFNRIRIFKEETRELFFAPEVAAAAIDCNIHIGNRFVDLIRAERERSDLKSIEEKYGYSYDTVVSSAASKTLLLVELLKGSEPDPEPIEAPIEPEAESAEPSRIDFERAPAAENSPYSPPSVNKWFVIAAIIVIMASVGIYFWSQNVSEGQGSIEVASQVDLGTTELKNHLRQASTSNETLYAMTQPTWDALSEDEQKAVLEKAYSFAIAIKMKRVNILNNKGRTVAFASEDRTELFKP